MVCLGLYLNCMKNNNVWKYIKSIPSLNAASLSSQKIWVHMFYDEITLYVSSRMSMYIFVWYAL